MFTAFNLVLLYSLLCVLLFHSLHQHFHSAFSLCYLSSGPVALLHPPLPPPNESSDHWGKCSVVVKRPEMEDLNTTHTHARTHAPLRLVLSFPENVWCHAVIDGLRSETEQPPLFVRLGSTWLRSTSWDWAKPGWLAKVGLCRCNPASFVPPPKKNSREEKVARLSKHGT